VISMDVMFVIQMMTINLSIHFSCFLFLEWSTIFIVFYSITFFIATEQHLFAKLEATKVSWPRKHFVTSNMVFKEIFCNLG